jgi:sugar (pentulose or hexulose) kinase
MSERIKDIIESGQAVAGIELGSTRIKAVLIDDKHNPIASGSYGWENSLIDGIWTYSMEEVETGLRQAYSNLKQEVQEKYGITLKKLKGLGISAMMHGYLVFDNKGELLVPFRTWRNNISGPASEKLTDLLSFPIPQRWSVAHVFQAMLNGEEHIPRIDSLTTLSSYIHRKLTNRNVVGIGEASGMFPVDSSTKDFRTDLLSKFDKEAGQFNPGWKLKEIFPEVLCAGEDAGSLTPEGARWIDPEGDLKEGVPLCPPEGDAGTGMVATNSIAVRTGNVSAGTSTFAMVVLENDLKAVHHEIDMITTPDGYQVAMAHSNNCTSDFNAWVSLLAEGARLMGADFNTDSLYEKMMHKALEGDRDGGGLLSIGYLSGEHITGFTEGRPLFVRKPDSNFSLENFLKVHLYSSICALKTGMDILFDRENVKVDEIRGHGGFFKTPGVGQRIMAAALNTPVSQLATAGEGGAWGIALLASFRVGKKEGELLPDFLNKVFADSMGEAMKPDPEDVKGFKTYFDSYHRGLAVERAAVESL